MSLDIKKLLAFDNGYCDVVRFERSAWRWNHGHNVLGVTWNPATFLRVVGNIYENPELLSKITEDSNTAD